MGAPRFITRNAVTRPGRWGRPPVVRSTAHPGSSSFIALGSFLSFLRALRRSSGARPPRPPRTHARRKRFIRRRADPQPMQQHRQLARHGHHGSFLRSRTASRGQLQTPTAQRAGRPERAKDVVRATDQQPAQISVARLGDAQLFIRLARLIKVARRATPPSGCNGQSHGSKAPCASAVKRMVKAGFSGTSSPARISPAPIAAFIRHASTKAMRVRRRASCGA